MCRILALKVFFAAYALCARVSFTLAQKTPSPASGTALSPIAKTNAPLTPVPTEVTETTSPTEVPETLASTPVPTFAPTTAAPTTPGPTPAPTLSPSPSPTMSPTPVPTPYPGTLAPTAPPTFSYDSYCERPYSSNLTDIPCDSEMAPRIFEAEMVSVQDKMSGAGAFFDETGCGFAGRSVAGCNLNGVKSCRLCVFNRGLYSNQILNGSMVPFPDCPCCVPELYGLGGDIDCDFPPTPAPVPAPTRRPVSPIAQPVSKGTPAPLLASVSTPSPSTVDRGGISSSFLDTATPVPTAPLSTPSPTIPPISMLPCERGAEGALAGNTTLCVDLATDLDLDAGIGYHYEPECKGLGCNIFNETDCRQCLYDRAAYFASGQEGGQDLVDCECCVPIVYRVRPAASDCIWPLTPAPTSIPTTYEEFLAASGASRARGGWTDSLVLLLSAAVPGLAALAIL